jgi:hypothetical protein
MLAGPRLTATRVHFPAVGGDRDFVGKSQIPTPKAFASGSPNSKESSILKLKKGALGWNFDIDPWSFPGAWGLESVRRCSGQALELSAQPTVEHLMGRERPSERAPKWFASEDCRAGWELV